MAKPTLLDRVKMSIARSKADVFMPADFVKFGGYDQVGRALRQLIKQGRLVKAGYGVYVKARPSGMTGNPIPKVQLVTIGLSVMEKLGIKADLGKSAREYRDGKTTQMPMVTALDVGRSRIRRKIKVGQRVIRYDREAR